MPATIQLHVWTGNAPGTSSASVGGIAYLSTDSAASEAATRLSYPVATCTYSYEKLITACLSTAPTNNVSNFLLWGGGTASATQTKIFVGTASAYVAPVATCSGSANTDFSTKTTGAKLAWDAASYAAAGSNTQWLVTQLVAFTAASAGNFAETMSYSYDET